MNEQAHGNTHCLRGAQTPETRSLLSGLRNAQRKASVLQRLQGRFVRQAAEIMGSSSLQAAIVTAIVMFIGRTINRKKYLVVSNESGLHVDHGSNFSNDVAIFEKEGLILTNKYFDVPPKVAIEIDVQIDLENFSAREQSYIYEKTERLLAFGVERVIWITTQPQKIFIANRTGDWITHNWDIDVPVLDDCVLNLAELLREEGIGY